MDISHFQTGTPSGPLTSSVSVDQVKCSPSIQRGRLLEEWGDTNFFPTDSLCMATMSIIMFALDKNFTGLQKEKKTVIQFYPNNCWKSCNTWILGTLSRPLHPPSGRKGKSAAILLS